MRAANSHNSLDARRKLDARLARDDDEVLRAGERRTAETGERKITFAPRGHSTIYLRFGRCKPARERGTVEMKRDFVLC